MATVEEQLAAANAEIEHWKNNHAAEVRRARILKERTDMPIERVPAYEKWGEDQKQLAAANAEIERLKTSEVHRTLNAEVNELREQLATKDQQIAELSEQVDLQIPKSAFNQLNQQLAAANAEIERLRFALADTEALEIGTGERLAAAQLQIKTLRLALQTYIDEHEECQDADDWMAMMCSIEAHHVADEALSLPQDLSALHSYGKRIADEVERRTVERCAKAVWNAKPSQKAIDEIPAAYQLASLSAIRALPLGQIDVEELGK